MSYIESYHNGVALFLFTKNIAKDGLIDAINKTLKGVTDSLRERASKIYAEIQTFEPLPTYTPNEEAKYAADMKSIFKKLTALVDQVSDVLEQAKKESGAMEVQVSVLLPSYSFAQSEVKRILTACCINTAARIITSKAAQNASGNLNASIDSTLNFAKDNELELPKAIQDALKGCQNRLKAASEATKQKSGAVSKP